MSKEMPSKKQHIADLRHNLHVFGGHMREEQRNLIVEAADLAWNAPAASSATRLAEAERRVGEMYDLLGAAENLIYTYRLGPGSDKVEALLNKWRNEWRRYALLASSDQGAEGEKSPLCNQTIGKIVDIGEGEK